MSDKSAFDTLVLELDPHERGELLSRLNRLTTVNTEPLHIFKAEGTEKVDYAAAYKELGLLAKAIIIVRSVLSGMSKEELVKERILRGIAKEADAAAPGLADTRRRVFLEPFRDELIALKAAARYFYDLLDQSLEKNRAEFFAFLASLRFERTHLELSTETDPGTFLERNALASDTDVRLAVNAALESALSRMEEDYRRLMLQDVRNLQCLKKLSGFLFDRLINGFQSAQSGRKELSFYTAADQLEQLATILLALEPPSAKLMEAILAFDLGEELANKDSGLEEAIKTESANASKALSAIRSFNARVPLEAVLKLVNEDPNWRCPSFSGGEDWFALFKSYWKDRIEKRYQKFVAERRIQQLDNDIVAMVGPEPPTWFEHLSETGAEASPPVRFTRALRFLEAFYHQLFLSDVNNVLKIVLLDGEFYKRDNRLEFTDAYNGMLQIGEGLKSLDHRLAPDGELGSTYYHAKNELIPLQIKKRKIESAVQAADVEAESLIRRANDAMLKMQLILKGIIAGEARGRYDSLSNLSSIEGKANKDFQRKLGLTKDKLEKTVFLLGELTRAALSGGDS
ncbi:MAG TPA: hypothetical protein DCG47_09985 [Spirochaetaceae bacterium]|nr:hypothetical protein [Spirochaetaceae bacterium]